MKSPVLKAPPPTAPSPPKMAPPGLTKHSPSQSRFLEPSSPLVDLANRLLLLEQKVDHVLAALDRILALRQTEADNPRSLSNHARPPSSGLIPESWHWEWGKLPDLDKGEDYHKCFYNGKRGHCEPGSPAVYWVQWRANRSPKQRKMCQSCGDYYKECVDGFLHF